MPIKNYVLVTKNQRLTDFILAKGSNYILVNDAGEKYVSVPVMPATRRYFLTVYKGRKGFVSTRADEPLGIMLALASAKEQYRRQQVRRKLTGVCLKLILNQDLEHGKIDELTLVTLGNLLDSTFREFFFLYVRGAAKTGCSDNYAICRFFEDFNIKEEEWSLDTAKRAYRYYMDKTPGYEERNARLRLKRESQSFVVSENF